MRRSVTALLLVMIFSGNLVFAGRDARNLRQKPVRVEIDPGMERPSKDGSGGIVQGASITWSVVDSMQNAFGPANSGSKMLAYDPLTDRLALIHRASTTYGAGSGQLWYNISNDGAVTWSRVGELNGGTELTLRYPSCALSNPTSSTNQADLLFTWAAPRLVSGAFGGITYGLDLYGAGGAFATQGSDTALSSQTSIWSVPGSAWVYWASEFSNTYRIWKTTDYVTVTDETPPTWQDTPANFSNPLGYINGDATANASYFAVQALFPNDSAEVINFGYSKSTDNGTTWSGWTRPQPDWRYATGIPLSWDLMDYLQPAGGTVDYIGDFLEDGTDRAHFFNAVVDSPWTATATRGILETYETGSGWESKWVTMDLHEQTNLVYGALAQTHNDIRAVISPDGSILAVLWLDAGTDSPTDTLPDVWFSWRQVNGGNWSTPENLTLTPNFAELLLHVAPKLKSNGGGSYTVFLSRTYEAGVTTYPPADGNRAIVYAGSYTFNTATSVGDESVPLKYALAQNYPNPFNPSTKIAFTIPQKSDVQLSVYNVLGEKVAELLNGVKESGTYEVGFSVANLPSGVYFYTLRAGQFSETKKMVLMK